MGKGKEGKVFSVRDMKVYRGGWGTAPLISNMEDMEVIGVARAPATLHPGGRHALPTE